MINLGSSQIVFLETFDEADDAFVRVDNEWGVVAWTAKRQGSLGVDDSLKVLSDKLAAEDRNGPATARERGDIDFMHRNLNLFQYRRIE